MEPKPSIRRAHPPRSTPQDAPATPDYAATTHYPPAQDPYTAPEAMDPYASAEPVLGPLADGPQFEPNPNLPPTRPLYRGNDLTEEQRINLALHPVGRVPRSGEPLAVRPSPPPMPPEPEPRSIRNAIIAGLTVVLVLAAIAGVFFVFLQLRDDDSQNGTSNQVAVETVSPSPSQAASGSGEGPAALVAGTPSTQASPAPSARPSSGDLAVVASAAASASGRPAATATARATTPTRPRVGAAAASDQAEASASSRSTTAESPLQGGSGSGTTADEMADFLPGEDGVPEPFALNGEGERSADDVANTFGGDPATVLAQLESWGWAGNAWQDFLASSNGEIPLDWINVSVHQFTSSEGAQEALPAFAEAVINGQGFTEVEVEGEPIGDNMIALSGNVAGVPNALLYVQVGQFLIKVQTSSGADDPMPATLDFTRDLVGRAGSQADETTASDTGASDDAETGAAAAEATEPSVPAA